MITTLLLLLLAAPPGNAQLAAVQISLDTQPRWPSGERVTITLAGSSREVSPQQIVDLLNTAFDSGFFEMEEHYSQKPEYSIRNGELILGSTIVTDEDREIITISIGAWSKRVVSDGEAPIGFRQLANAIREAASRAKQKEKP